MPPKAAAKAAGAAGLTKDEIMLLSIIKRAGISGIKWDDVATDVNDGRTGNAIRQKFQKMKLASEKEGGSAGSSEGADGAGEEEGGPVKPAAVKKKSAPRAPKKRKIEAVEEAAEDEDEDA